MKKIRLFISILISTFYIGQVNSASSVVLLPNKNSFIDASGFSTYAPNVGKGFVFPRANLTTWTFNTTDLGQYQYFQTAFDGMIVYNTATGNTGSTAATQGQQIAVTPGFYYFSNPTATADNTDVSTGKWIRMGADAAAAAWLLGGNAGVTAAQAKIGTQNAQNVDFIVNNATVQTFGKAADAAFNKVVINPNASANVSMATKAKTIGGTAFDFALEVGGKGYFENGIVTSASTYPDYVFDNYFTGKSKVNPTYKFSTLAETEKFIKENNHLPGVTKIDDLAKGGNGYMIDATQLSVQSLEKIEELYLHTIEQQKQIDELKAQIAELKALIKK